MKKELNDSKRFRLELLGSFLLKEVHKRGTYMKCFEKISADNFNNIKEIAYDKFVLAQRYGYAAKVLIDDVIEHNDNNVYICKIESIEEYYELDSKDFDLHHNTQTLVLPILFCTYQFIEQILKGLLYLCTDQKHTHKIDELYSSFKENYSDCIDLIDLLDKYVGDNLYESIKMFMIKNDIRNMSELYNSLRYADRKNKADVDYLNLKYYNAFNNQKNPGTYESKKSSIMFLEEIKNDFKLILKEARRIQLTIFDYYQAQQK